MDPELFYIMIEDKLIGLYDTYINEKLSDGNDKHAELCKNRRELNCKGTQRDKVHFLAFKLTEKFIHIHQKQYF